MQRRGFTLVELSIVLVIIGLLIGGILVAQSMIETAKVQSFVRQVQQFDIAIANFKTRFRSWPGDSSVMGCNSNAGATNVCDNGIIEDNDGNAQPGFQAYPIYFDYELANFWPQLQQGGFNYPGGTFSPTITGHFTVDGLNPNSPKAKIGTNTGIIPYWHYLMTSLGQDSEFYFFADWSKITTNVMDPNHTVSDESIPVVEALAVDTKLDDGLPNNPNNSNVGEDGFGPTETCSVGGHYNVSNPAAKCRLFIRMLSSSGLAN